MARDGPMGQRGPDEATRAAVRGRHRVRRREGPARGADGLQLLASAAQGLLQDLAGLSIEDPADEDGLGWSATTIVR